MAAEVPGLGSTADVASQPDFISPFYRVSVKALVFDADDRLLVVQEPAAHWELPGGGWEHGETLEQCLARELHEELDAHLDSVDLSTQRAWVGPGASGRYLKARLAGYPYEVFACLFLDSRNRVIAFEELFRGSIGGASVHPREVVRRCLAHNAAAIIVAHNHPSGVAEPSRDDRLITLRLRDALALVDVRVVDHFIVGDGTPISLAARGWLR